MCPQVDLAAGYGSPLPSAYPRDRVFAARREEEAHRDLHRPATGRVGAGRSPWRRRPAHLQRPHARRGSARRHHVRRGRETLARLARQPCLGCACAGNCPGQWPPDHPCERPAHGFCRRWCSNSGAGLSDASAPAISPTAHIHPTARLGPGATVGPFAVVGRGVGTRSELYFACRCCGRKVLQARPGRDAAPARGSLRRHHRRQPGHHPRQRRDWG